jgi:hypothetical protein
MAHSRKAEWRKPSGNSFCATGPLAPFRFYCSANNDQPLASVTGLQSFLKYAFLENPDLSA